MPYTRTKPKEKYKPQASRLLDQVREVLRYHHYAIRTEEAYLRWIVQYIKFNGTRHPKEMGKEEIERFLSSLAVDRHVAAATQNQALNAILFLYREVLQLPMDEKIEATRSRKKKRLPTVLSRDEVRKLSSNIQGTQLYNLEMVVGRGAECVIFFVWQGTTMSNSWPIARSCNAARRKIGRALRPVAASP